LGCQMRQVPQVAMLPIRDLLDVVETSGLVGVCL
jgi:hypothetical protein